MKHEGRGIRSEIQTSNIGYAHGLIRAFLLNVIIWKKKEQQLLLPRFCCNDK